MTDKCKKVRQCKIFEILRRNMTASSYMKNVAIQFQSNQILNVHIMGRFRFIKANPGKAQSKK